MKKPANIFCLLWLSSLVLIGACSKNSVGDVQVVDVKKEFTLVPFEKLEPGGGRLQLTATSLAPQNCSGTKIDYYSALVNNKVILTIKQYLPPANCDNLLSTVSDTLDLGKLEVGAYNLQINLKDAVLNNGSLAVDAASYSFKMATENGISLPVASILRVPAKTVWGYIDYADNMENVANNFIDSLKTLTSVAYNPAGDYHYFKIDASNQADFTVTDAKHAALKKFLFNLEKDETVLKALIDRFRAANKSAVDLKVYTYDGAIF